MPYAVVLWSMPSRLYRKPPGGPGAGAGGGVQTRVGVVVRVFETFIEVRQFQRDRMEQQTGKEA